MPPVVRGTRRPSAPRQGTTALVLGATGYIGGQIARAAVERGWHVRGLRRRPGSTGSVGELPIAWYEGDLDAATGLADALQGVDVVFHAAGYYPQRAAPVAEHVQRGVRQTRTVLANSRLAGVSRLVFTSTLSTIGRPPPGEDRLADERDLYVPGTLPTAAYYECKFAMESEVLRAHAEGLSAVVVNPTAVVGPGDTTPTLGGVVLAAARGRAWFWLEATVNLVDVRDVAAAHVAAAEQGAPGQRYILGGHNVTARQAIETLARLAGVPPPRFAVPMWALDGAAWMSDRLPGLSLLGNHVRAVRHWQGYETRKAREVLGLKPRPLEETLNDMLTAYADRGWLSPKRSVVA